MFRTKQPPGKAKPVMGKVRGHRGQDIRRIRLHLVAPLVILAAVENKRHGRLGPLLHHVRNGSARPDRGLFLLQGMMPGLELFGAGISSLQPPDEQGLGILVLPGTLLHGLAQKRQGAARGREISGLVGCEDQAIDPHVADADVVEPGRGVPLTHLQRNGRPDGVVQLIGRDLRVLKFSVDVDLDAGGLRRAVVGDQHVSPDVQRKLGASNHLQCVLRPLVDEVGCDLPVLDPEVPSAVVVLIIHPGDDRAEQPAFG